MGYMEKKTKEMQAVILAAGKSSRFWPLSEGTHKSGLKIMGLPLIEYTIRSIEESGIRSIIIIVGNDSTLQKDLSEPEVAGKRKAELIFVTQPEPKGMANALLCAETQITGQFFLLNPNHFRAEKYISLMLEKRKSSGSDMILLGAPTDTPEKYGIFSLSGEKQDRAISIIEKPKAEHAPSDIRVVGIYLLPKEILDYCKKIPEEEYSFEKALSSYMKSSEVKVALTEDPPYSLKYPWEFLDFTKDIIHAQLKNKKDIRSKPHKTASISGFIHIGKNTVIHENAVIKDNVWIGDNCVIGNNTVIRTNTNIEDSVMVGANTEIARSSIQSGTHIHSGFIGDSVISEECRIGAGFITANKRIDRETIRCEVKGEKVDTKRSSLGVIIGPGTSIGINSNTMPGTMVGSGAIIGSNTALEHNLESDMIIYTKFSTTTKQKHKNQDNSS